LIHRTRLFFGKWGLGKWGLAIFLSSRILCQIGKWGLAIFLENGDWLFF